eukprot:m.13517 g.13517  ORF g.13517 m.13517 type:complete len:54 (-) comp8450_c0_seq1:251-412(-)
MGEREGVVRYFPPLSTALIALAMINFQVCQNNQEGKKRMTSTHIREKTEAVLF